jgi:hypothetical protein
MALRESRCRRRLMRRKEEDNERSCLGLGKDRVQLIYKGFFCVVVSLRRSLLLCVVGHGYQSGEEERLERLMVFRSWIW